MFKNTLIWVKVLKDTLLMGEKGLNGKRAEGHFLSKCFCGEKELIDKLMRNICCVLKMLREKC